MMARKNTRKEQPRQRVTYAPLAISRPYPRQRDPVVRMGGNCTTISHVEAFTYVTPAAGTFEVVTFSVNPALASCFPWLAQVAARYDSYRFRKLAFRYTANSGAQLSGQVTQSFNPDPTDGAPDDMFAALQYKNRSNDVIWKEQLLTVNLAESTMPNYKYKTRVGTPLGTNFDIKTYDVGNLYIATEGATPATLGRVDVEYVVDLFSPETKPPIGGLMESSSGLSQTALFGTNIVYTQQTLMPFTVTSASTITFNQRWSGIMAGYFEGDAMAGNALVPTIVGRDSTVALIDGIAEGTYNTSINNFRVNAYPGTTLSFAYGAANAVSHTHWAVATAGYQAL